MPSKSLHASKPVIVGIKHDYENERGLEDAVNLVRVQLNGLPKGSRVAIPHGDVFYGQYQNEALARGLTLVEIGGAKNVNSHSRKQPIIDLDLRTRNESTNEDEIARHSINVNDCLETLRRESPTVTIVPLRHAIEMTRVLGDKYHVILQAEAKDEEIETNERNRHKYADMYELIDRARSRRFK